MELIASLTAFALLLLIIHSHENFITQDFPILSLETRAKGIGNYLFRGAEVVSRTPDSLTLSCSTRKFKLIAEESISQNVSHQSIFDLDSFELLIFQIFCTNTNNINIFPSTKHSEWVGQPKNGCYEKKLLTHLHILPSTNFCQHPCAMISVHAYR